jgi:hypothetical protein
MTRVQRLLMPVTALALAAVVTTIAIAQAPQGSRRGFRMGSSRDSLLGLLRIEQVRNELKLSAEETGKVTELSEKLRAEMREKSTALREIDDQAQRRVKMTELMDESNRKASGQLRELLSREQMMRLYQIRMQVRPLTDSLANRRVASRLQLTEAQQSKVAAIVKAVQTQQSQLRGSMRNLRDATQEQRTEVFQKSRKIRIAAEEEVLGLLTGEQKEALEKMKGPKIELPARRGRRRNT